jgi:hypothetical protein
MTGQAIPLTPLQTAGGQRPSDTGGGVNNLTDSSVTLRFNLHHGHMQNDLPPETNLPKYQHVATNGLLSAVVRLVPAEECGQIARRLHPEDGYRFDVSSHPDSVPEIRDDPVASPGYESLHVGGNVLGILCVETGEGGRIIRIITLQPPLGQALELILNIPGYRIRPGRAEERVTASLNVVR